MNNQRVQAAVGMTRKWDAREAGREVARNTIRQLDSPPKFFLLFSTIHYIDYGGFKEFLSGVWEVLPKGTPLVGGTVIGFINNFGCFARGASALAVSYPNKFLLNFIAGPGAIKIPGQGYKKVVDSGFISKFIIQAFGISQYILQKGFGREDEIFEEMTKLLPDYNMILGTSIDDYKGLHNYQFFNHEILTNSMINLAIASDLDLDVFTNHGMKKSNIKFNITKLTRNRHIIREINNKSAVQELYRILNWPEGFVNEKTIGHTILYYPISVKRHEREIPVVMPYFLKNSVMTPCVIDDGEVSIMTINGKNFIEAIENNLEHFNNEIQPEFGLFSTCMTILVTLGYKVNMIREEVCNYFKDKPFLMFFSAGEGTYSPKSKITYANMSFNTSVFGQNKKSHLF